MTSQREWHEHWVQTTATVLSVRVGIAPEAAIACAEVFYEMYASAFRLLATPVDGLDDVRRVVASDEILGERYLNDPVMHALVSLVAQLQAKLHESRIRPEVVRSFNEGLRERALVADPIDEQSMRKFIDPYSKEE